MKVKTCNKIKNYQSVFSKQKEIKELELQVGKYQIVITEHQLGIDLTEPHVEVFDGNNGYSMNLEEFINRAIK